MSNWKDKFPKESRYFETDNGILYCANVLEILSKFPAESIDCIITSPPYWGLRDYGEQARIIWNGDKTCKHEWESIILPNPGGIPKKKCGVGNWDRQIENPEFAVKGRPQESLFCKRCGAWYGQLGLEPTLNLYIEHLFEIMKELKRVLKKTGVIFWNHNDCYSGSGKGYGSIDPKYPSARDTRNTIRPNRFKIEIPQKCMCLQNYRFILKCVDELGLILRNIIIWYKPNHMPSSVKDRFTNAYEPIFMLVKSKRYWFDLDAVRISHKSVEVCRLKCKRHDCSSKQYSKYTHGPDDYHPLGKNPGDLWEIPTQPFPESHFATFSEKLVEPMIKCACPQWICKKCSFIRERIIEKKLVVHKVFEDKGKAYQNVISGSKEMPAIPRARTGLEGHNEIYTVGWTNCGCNAGWESGIVLDPFMGSGTVAVVAERLGRRWIGIEINSEYCEIAKKRILKETRQLKLNFK